eukprot:TRINITY_DN1617_c0_g1_i1.p1 TRINITY_DN1617_c0_g1~~TRINITY_DN1617_c0_g1_i1.p1  ORF type:complete len:1146 (-),score=470.77 TRINITY_DN1617_c0_g1_i1:49-3486(-)
MYIHRAHTGAKFQVDVDPNFPVERLKELCVGPSGVPKDDQILLCGGIKLEKNRTLGYYGLPQDSKAVFLFDKRVLEPDAPAPDEVILPPVELKVTPAPPLPQGQELERSPLLWALLKYENQFLSDLNTAEAMKKVIEARTDICKSCISEQETQVRGLEAAVANLNDQFNQIIVAHNGFQEYSRAAFAKHDKYLQGFNADMQKLKDIKLHPALLRQGMNVLMDCVPEAKLWKWAEECKNEHSGLQNLVSELDRQISYLRDNVEDEQRRSLDVDFNKLRSQFKRANDIAAEVSLRFQIFSNDYNNIRSTVEKAKMAKHLQGGICDGFEDIQHEHSRHLSGMNENDKTVQSITSECASSKTRLSRSVHERLRSISLIQSKIREQANKILLYNEALSRQKAAFQQLAYVHSMPSAYRSSLDEVSRRKKWKKSMGNFVTKTNERISKLRDEENGRRQTFLSNFGRFIPRDLIPGLTQDLPQFEVELKPFDSALPNIVIEGDKSASQEEEELSILFSNMGEEKHQRLQELERENEKLLQHIKILSSSQNAGTSPPVFNAPSGHHSNTNEGFGRSRSYSEVQDPSGDYRQRIEVLESKLSSTYSQIEKTDLMVQQYKSKCEIAEKQMIEKAREVEDKTALHDQMNLQIQELREQLGMADSIDRKLRRTETELQETMRQMKELETSSRLAAEEKDRLENENFSLKDEMEAMRQSMSEQQNLVRDYEDRLKKSRKEIIDLQEEMTKTSLSLEQGEDQQKQTIQKLEAKINEYENELNNRQEDIGRINEKLEQKTVETKNLEGKVVEWKKKSSDLEVEIKDLSIVIDESRKQIEQLTAEKVQLPVKINNLNEELENLEEKHAQVVSKMEANEIEFAKKSEDYLSKIGTLESSNDQLKRELELARQEQQQQGLANSQIFEENSRTLGNQVQQMRLTIEQHERAISDKDKALEQTKNEYSSLRDKYLDLVKRVESFRKSAEQSEEDKKRARSEVDYLKQSLSEAEFAIKRHSDEMKSVTGAGNVMRDRIKALEMTLEGSEKKNMQYHEEIESLRYMASSKSSGGIVIPSKPNIALTNFKVDDWMLFLSKNGHYEAWNNGEPNYYLSQTVIEALDHKTKDPILAQAIEIVKNRASADDNPFELPNGTTYYEVLATVDQ